MQIPLLDKMKNPLPLILGALGAGLLVVGFLTFRMVQPSSSALDLEKYTVTATQETLAVEIKASGTVQPVQTVNISPKTPGRLMENREVFAEGMQSQAKFEETIARFKEAQIKIPMELRQRESDVNQAQTRVAQARSQLAIAQDRLRQVQARIPKDIDQFRAQLNASASRLQLAENRMNRNKNLIEEGAISRDRFDEVSNDYLSAKAGLIESLGKLDQAKNTADPELGQIEQQIQQLRAAVVESEQALKGQIAAFEQRQYTAKAELASLKAVAAAAQADLERVKIQYQDTFIVAPFAGTITQKFATVGAFVTPTTSLLALARGLEIVAKVPEVDIMTLKLGQTVKITADAFPNEVFQGKVIRIAPEAIVENNVTSFEVTVALITGQEKLRSKMNADVIFMGDNLKDALTVPTVAIVTLAGKTGVMIPGKDNQPKFQSVKIGLVLDDKTQILSGIDGGQRVFIDLPEGSQDPQSDKNK